MTRKKKILNTLADYFITKGKVLSKKEYKRQIDVPVRSTVILRELSSWSRIEPLIKRNFPEKYVEIIAEDEEESSTSSALFRGLLAKKEGAKIEDN